MQAEKACHKFVYGFFSVNHLRVYPPYNKSIVSAILAIIIMQPSKIAKIVKVLNAIDVLGLAFLLLVAFVLQIGFHELPCPLCILQRIGVLGIAFGFLLNVQFKMRPAHYTLALLSAMLTAAISIRQIFLHVVPGDPGYGLPLLGLHLYTWLFLLCVAVIAYIAIIFSILPQYQYDELSKSRGMKLLTHIAFGLVFLLAVFNGISAYLECGIKACSENPVKYEIQLVESHVFHT